MKKKGKGKKKVPQKGDPDYLSPTQLRNRRKRRAKKQQQQSGNTNNDSKSTSSPNNNKTTHHNIKDPSMKYISNPIKAPIVQAAKQYFQSILKDSNTSEFLVHLGPLYKWRTVSKLAVRADSTNTKLAIGLFIPQSHTLLPVPNCRAHHPSINHAVECITKVCNDVGVQPYQESGSKTNEEGDNIGSGQLRYIAINVARETGAVQITLVWNTPPPSSSNHDEVGKRKHAESIEDITLKKLVAKIISMSSDNSNTTTTTVNDQKDRDIAKTNDGSNCKSIGDEQPTKKKRRRGRRDKDKDNTQTNNRSDTTERKEDSPHKAKGNKQGNAYTSKLNFHSLHINYNESWKHSNAIFSFDSACWQHVYGPQAIIEHLSFDKSREASNNPDILANPKLPNFRIPLHFPPNVFRQANIDAFTNIVARIRERIQTLGNESSSSINCVELYGGVGTIGLHISDVVSSLVSSDENPNNAKCFYDSVRELPTDIQSRLVYRQKNATDMVTTEQALFQNCQVLIVDPPRKGLDDEVVQYLYKEGYKSMKLVVYVSCGFQAFQRDRDALIKSGKWKVQFAEGYILFPGSDALETLAFFVPI